MEMQKLRDDLDECYKALHFIQVEMAKQKIDEKVLESALRR